MFNDLRQITRRSFCVAALVLVPICLTVLCPAETALRPGSNFQWNGCYAQMANGELKIGNTHVSRRWKVHDGQLFPVSLRDEDAGKEWMGAESSLSAPAPPAKAADGVTELRGAGGVFGPTQEHSLRVELQITGRQGGVTRYEFEVFAQASGIRMWMEQSGVDQTVATANDPEVTTGVADQKLPTLDVLDRLKLSSPHIRFIQVTLRDRTDERNELAFEDEWLLHPNEGGLRKAGNVFVVEDVLTRTGVVFLKEAPQPEMRPVQTLSDVSVEGGGMTTRSGDKPGSGTAPAYDIVFTSHGFTGNGRGYPYTMLTYHGGEAGRVAALHRYQQQIRPYVPGRDGQLITNTWGDRSGSSRINLQFVEREIDGAKRLGADVMQVDDGWETGKTSASHANGGIWEGYWSKPNFWIPDPARFPNGLRPAAQYAHSRGMKLGLWFGPDSSQDFANWQRDVSKILQFHSKDDIDAFKLDSVKIRSKAAEGNYHHLLDELQEKTIGTMLVDLDVTAETRQGYFGNIAAGPLFVENRYTDMHRYWPHQTLRNFWKLSHYVDPVRLRMEFLNNARNAVLYPNDPLAPEHYDPACLFAITMFGSPLGWFETTGLSEEYLASVNPLIKTWKQHRDAIYRGTILPIGNVPDGVSWTGFTSINSSGSGYLLAFREDNKSQDWIVPMAFAGKASVLGGQGSMRQSSNGEWTVHIDKPLGFVWLKLDASVAAR